MSSDILIGCGLDPLQDYRITAGWLACISEWNIRDS